MAFAATGGAAGGADDDVWADFQSIAARKAQQKKEEEEAAARALEEEAQQRAALEEEEKRVEQVGRELALRAWQVAWQVLLVIAAGLAVKGKWAERGASRELGPGELGD
jgi:hypothetical protein